MARLPVLWNTGSSRAKRQPAANPDKQGGSHGSVQFFIGIDLGLDLIGHFFIQRTKPWPRF
jgi:hypothetical protein